MNRDQWLLLIIVFSLIGIGADALLTYNKLTDSAVGCAAGGGCDIVKGSIYSEFMGIPVSIFGLGTFALFILLALLARAGTIQKEWAFKITALFGIIGLLIAAYFVYIMLVVLEAICPWCFLSHAALLLTTVFAYKGMEAKK